jgi:inner membrane protein
MAFQLGESGSVTLKAVLIGAIVLLLLVPLGMLRGLVTERSSLREQAYARVAQGWGGSAVLGGPMLVVPTQRTLVEKVEDKNGEREITRIVRTDLYLLPARLDMDVDLQLQDEARYVGIYAVPVYLASVRFKGEFEFAALQPLLGTPGVTYLWHESRLRLPASEVHSLREVSVASFAGQTVKLGPAQPGVFRGIEARVDLTQLAQTASAAFEFHAVTAGSRGLSLLPLGSTTTLQMNSNWPHPSFDGAFLPAERTITAEGFEARWQVLELNRSYAQAFSEHEVDAAALSASAFGVGLYQAVDVYQRSERAVKYAMLFIALTFLTFFAWEQITRNPLHPLQYLMIGLALSIFYLLLIALSEHISFAAAYLAAAVALVALIGVYVAGALRSSMRGAISAVAMSGVYALLYALVLSEDYALLLGAIVLFVALAAVMLVTRRIDWYRLGSRPSTVTTDAA